MTYHGIEIPREKLAEFCKRNHVCRLSLFGSISGADFGPESDVDVLVDKGLNNSIPWAQIVGMRNRMIHAYFDVDQDEVWRTVTEELPVLAEQLRAILDAAEQQKS